MTTLGLLKNSLKTMSRPIQDYLETPSRNIKMTGLWIKILDPPFLRNRVKWDILGGWGNSFAIDKPTHRFLAPCYA